MSDVQSDLHRVKGYVSDLRRANQSRLPPEAKLAEQLSLTRSRLRTVLRTLEQEGLIWRHVGKGTFVGRRTGLSASASAQIASPSDIMEARLAIEPQLAALAAVRATQAQIEDIRACLAKMDESADYEEWKLYDDRLHRLVGVAAGNAVLLAMLDSLQAMDPGGMAARASRVLVADRLKQANDEHRAYVTAIEERDAELAEAKMVEHIISVRSILFGARAG